MARELVGTENTYGQSDLIRVGERSRWLLTSYRRHHRVTDPYAQQSLSPLPANEVKVHRVVHPSYWSTIPSHEGHAPVPKGYIKDAFALNQRVIKRSTAGEAAQTGLWDNRERDLRRAHPRTAAAVTHALAGLVCAGATVPTRRRPC